MDVDGPFFKGEVGVRVGARGPQHHGPVCTQRRRNTRVQCRVQCRVLVPVVGQLSHILGQRQASCVRVSAGAGAGHATTQGEADAMDTAGCDRRALPVTGALRVAVEPPGWRARGHGSDSARS